MAKEKTVTQGKCFRYFLAGLSHKFRDLKITTIYYLVLDNFAAC